MADGLNAAQLNSGTGGINLGLDQVTITGTATDFQVIKIGYSDAGTSPVQVGPSQPLPINGTIAVNNYPATQVVSLAGANGTVNVVSFPAKQVVSLAGADGTVNVTGTVPILFAGGGTFTLGTVAFAGTPGVALAGANGTVNIVTLAAGTATVIIAGTLGTINVNNFPASQVVTLAGASGTVNVVGTVPVLVAASSTFTLGTIAFAGTPGVALAGANGTVNIVTLAVGTATVLIAGTLGTINVNNFPATQAVSLTGANGTVNLVGTIPVLNVAGTFTLGTVALAGTPGVALTGANGTVNIVTLAAGTATVVIIGANGTVNIAGSATIAAANAPNSGLAVLSVYNTAAPAPTSGQSAALQSDYASSLFFVKRRAQSKSGSLNVAGGGTGTLLAAQAAGIFADLAGIVITVRSLAATGIYQLALTDGTTTYQYNLGLAAGGTAGISVPFVAMFDPPLPAGGAAAPWTIRGLSTNGTVDITGNFVLQKQA